MSFMLSSQIDNNKVFMVNLTDIEKRLDPFFYIPELTELEQLVKSKTKYRLKDFCIFRGSGATPTKSDKSLYSDRENGVPFIRVQNLSTTGILDLTDVVYISHETHNGLLKRSQVKEFDLLIKITGVGRMAIASVAPEGFVGNINQHIVVVRTGSREISENLAAFINLDSIEKLAFKRATGGTRPALDYPALFSIPVMNDRVIFDSINHAIQIKQQKEKEASDLLATIDDYLFSELGIILPEKDSSLESRIFITNLNKVSGKRLDPNNIRNFRILYNQQWKYPKVALGNLLIKSPQYGANEEACDGDPKNGIRYIRITDIDEIGNLKEDSWKTAAKIEDKYLLNFNDILFARSGSVGKCYIHKNTKQSSIFAGYLIRFVIDQKLINSDYLFFFCNSAIYKFWVNSIERPAVQSNINSEEYKSLLLPLPDLSKQNEIVKYIQQIRAKAIQLQKEGEDILENAKQDIERMILGEK